MHRSDRLSLAIKEVANSVVSSIKKKGGGGGGGTANNTKSSNGIGVSSMQTKLHNTSINNDDDFKFDLDKKASSNNKEEVKRAAEEEKSAKSNFFE